MDPSALAHPVHLGQLDVQGEEVVDNLNSWNSDKVSLTPAGQSCPVEVQDLNVADAVKTQGNKGNSSSRGLWVP